MLNKESIINRLKNIYPYNDEIDIEELYDRIHLLLNKYQSNMKKSEKIGLSEKDVMLITYGDSLYDNERHSLEVLNKFLMENIESALSAVHILPFYPYSSDDGFSVIDYRKVNHDLGNWDDIIRISKDYDLMFDGVINHISKESEWFKGYLDGDKQYKDYFITCDPKLDYGSVVRPRALPLLSKVLTREGEKYVWTTFSDDQIDLNYDNPEVLLEVMDVLLFYVLQGARYIRLDAIGFLWKEIGTSCIHLEKTHEVVKLLREVLESIAPNSVIITETNVPHEENISYFGNGFDEAHMVYQFPLPPLTLFTFLSEDATKLLEWANTIDAVSDETTFFNFLASHDGIGLRPVEDILSKEEIQYMVDTVLARQGKVSEKDNGDGTKSPYELNINYLSALSRDDDSSDTMIKRFIASQGVLLSMVGVPGIYIHSLIGSTNDVAGMKQSGINRRINREKINYHQLARELNDTDNKRSKIFNGYKHLLTVRKHEICFSPKAKQKVLFLHKKVFSIERMHPSGRRILVLINISNDCCKLQLPYNGRDIITGRGIEDDYTLKSYEMIWMEGR